jgi:hypothetical protein
MWASWFGAGLGRRLMMGVLGAEFVFPTYPPLISYPLVMMDLGCAGPDTHRNRRSMAFVWEFV